ncbi:MAG: hypothetical protein HY907_07795 [Deltaproteobacteria bacterium]|nr:hypothetical protein [Deltaproteobacteria bacterium]
MEPIMRIMCVAVVGGALAACGPPPATPIPGSGVATGDAGAANEAGPGDASSAEVEEDFAADPAPEEQAPSPAEAAFRRALEALLSGSARAVRELVPAGGLLVLASNVCRKPLYGVGTCHQERVEAERRRIADEVLAPFQDLLARAAQADPGFRVDALAAECTAGDGARWTCRAELPLGNDACRGDRRAPVRAVVLDGGESWVLVELGYEEEILVCE